MKGLPVKLALLVAAVQLGACGFTLRGSADLPAELRTLQLQTLDSNTDIVRQLRRQLDASGVTIIDESRAGVYALGIGREQTVERVLSVNANARAREYELNMSVPFQLRRGEEFAIPRQNLTAQRVYLADPNNAVAKEEEAELIREEMRRELVRSIMSRLQSVTP